MPYTADAALQERKRHGSALFPFNIYPCNIPGDFPAVALHWQRSMELIFIKRGNGICRVGQKSRAAAPGDIFIVPPGTLHALSWAAPAGAPTERMEYENIIVDVDFLGAGAADICAQDYLVPLAAGRLILPARLRPGTPGYDEPAACLERMEQLCEQRRPGYELGVKAALLQFMSALFATGEIPTAPAEPPDVERLKAVLAKVEKEYARPMRVSDMASSIGCSASHFMKWFKANTGTGFAAYLNDRRLSAAAERLRETSDSVLEIAGLCGFENLSNFNRRFKARYGKTPREYRAGTVKYPDCPEYE